jgi:hypothetical protein
VNHRGTEAGGYAETNGRRNQTAIGRWALAPIILSRASSFSTNKIDPGRPNRNAKSYGFNFAWCNVHEETGQSNPGFIRNRRSSVFIGGQ